MTWILKACPKCGGDLHMEASLVAEGHFSTEDRSWVCLQCGYREQTKEPEYVHVGGRK